MAQNKWYDADTLAVPVTFNLAEISDQLTKFNTEQELLVAAEAIRMVAEHIVPVFNAAGLLMKQLKLTAGLFNEVAQPPRKPRANTPFDFLTSIIAGLPVPVESKIKTLTDMGHDETELQVHEGYWLNRQPPLPPPLPEAVPGPPSPPAVRHVQPSTSATEWRTANQPKRPARTLSTATDTASAATFTSFTAPPSTAATFTSFTAPPSIAATAETVQLEEEEMDYRFTEETGVGLLASTMAAVDGGTYTPTLSPNFGFGAEFEVIINRFGFHKPQEPYQAVPYAAVTADWSHRTIESVTAVHPNPPNLMETTLWKLEGKKLLQLFKMDKSLYTAIPTMLNYALEPAQPISQSSTLNLEPVLELIYVSKLDSLESGDIFSTLVGTAAISEQLRLTYQAEFYYWSQFDRMCEYYLTILATSDPSAFSGNNAEATAIVEVAGLIGATWRERLTYKGLLNSWTVPDHEHRSDAMRDVAEQIKRGKSGTRIAFNPILNNHTVTAIRLPLVDFAGMLRSIEQVASWIPQFEQSMNYIAFYERVVNYANAMYTTLCRTSARRTWVAGARPQVIKILCDLGLPYNAFFRTVMVHLFGAAMPWLISESNEIYLNLPLSNLYLSPALWPEPHLEKQAADMAAAADQEMLRIHETAGQVAAMTHRLDIANQLFDELMTNAGNPGNLVERDGLVESATFCKILGFRALHALESSHLDHIDAVSRQWTDAYSNGVVMNPIHTPISNTMLALIRNVPKGCPGTPSLNLLIPIDADQCSSSPIYDYVFEMLLRRLRDRYNAETGIYTALPSDGARMPDPVDVVRRMQTHMVRLQTAAAAPVDFAGALAPATAAAGSAAAAPAQTDSAVRWKDNNPGSSVVLITYRGTERAYHSFRPDEVSTFTEDELYHYNLAQAMIRSNNIDLNLTPAAGSYSGGISSVRPKSALLTDMTNITLVVVDDAMDTAQDTRRAGPSITSATRSHEWTPSQNQVVPPLPSLPILNLTPARPADISFAMEKQEPAIQMAARAASSRRREDPFEKIDVPEIFQVPATVPALAPQPAAPTHQYKAVRSVPKTLPPAGPVGEFSFSVPVGSVVVPPSNLFYGTASSPPSSPSSSPSSSLSSSPILWGKGASESAAFVAPRSESIFEPIRTSTVNDFRGTAVVPPLNLTPAATVPPPARFSVPINQSPAMPVHGDKNAYFYLLRKDEPTVEMNGPSYDAIKDKNLQELADVIKTEMQTGQCSRTVRPIVCYMNKIAEIWNAPGPETYHTAQFATPANKFEGTFRVDDVFQLGNLLVEVGTGNVTKYVGGYDATVNAANLSFSLYGDGVTGAFRTETVRLGIHAALDAAGKRSSMFYGNVDAVACTEICRRQNVQWFKWLIHVMAFDNLTITKKAEADHLFHAMALNFVHILVINRIDSVLLPLPGIGIYGNTITTVMNEFIRYVMFYAGTFINRFEKGLKIGLVVDKAYVREVFRCVNFYGTRFGGLAISDTTTPISYMVAQKPA
uniref:Protein ORF40 n=1 Tax=Anguillid herpesvirus 1 TaxID=150286 RepID=A0A8E5EUE6_9VIRU|nr:protein ORF40 [Anguillid herpesvirus 1]